MEAYLVSTHNIGDAGKVVNSAQIFLIYSLNHWPKQYARGRLSCISIRGKDYKVCLYADDILVTLADPDSSLPAVMGILETCKTYTGYVLNTLHFDWLRNLEISKLSR